MYSVLKKYIKDEKVGGFTFVEMLIYIALIGVVVTGFVSFALSIVDSRNKNYAMQEVQANARIALGVVTQKVMASNGINIDDSVFGSDPGVLSLSMKDSDKDPTIINLDTDNGHLQIIEGSNAPEVYTSDEVEITNFVFNNFTSPQGRGNVGIEMTFEFNNKGNNVQYDYEQKLQTSISLRQ